MKKNHSKDTKNVLLKNSIKEIITNRKRFISILLMALLGVGFFAGLVLSGPTMQKNLDSFLDETDTYDINILSTLGLTDEDIDALKEIDGVLNVVRNKKPRCGCRNYRR